MKLVLLIAVSLLSIGLAQPARVQQISATNPREFAGFGTAISSFGPRLLVGAQWSNNFLGTAYLYKRRRGKYVLVQRFKPPSPVTGYGVSVALGRDILAIGDVQFVYIYQKRGSRYRLATKLFAGDVGGKLFSASIKISGNLLLVGDVLAKRVFMYQRSTKSGKLTYSFKQKFKPATRGKQNFGASADADLKYMFLGGGSTLPKVTGQMDVYRLRRGKWVKSQSIRSPQLPKAVDFGSSVSMFGNMAAIGASKLRNKGAVLLYTRNSKGRYRRTVTLVPPKRKKIASFGVSVSAHRNSVLVGARGAAFLFRKRGSKWALVRCFRPKKPDAGFGFRVHLSSVVAVVTTGYDTAKGPFQGGAVTTYRL
mmetsp:Transcript_10312/g.31542  ORF Transcript_10312/g.31542 Transcript_10312/m.31542 type:complete len:366 (+) Transcript_10312:207-1304(+)